MPTFEGLHSIAKNQYAQLCRDEPPDTDMGIAAVTVSVTLFNWIANNATDEQTAEVAKLVATALGLETT